MRFFTFIFAGFLTVNSVQASFLINADSDEGGKETLKAVQLIHSKPFGTAEAFNKDLEDTGVQLTWVPPTLWDLNMIRVHFRESQVKDSQIYPRIRDRRNNFKDSFVLDVGSESFCDFLRQNQINQDDLVKRSSDVFDLLMAEVRQFKIEEDVPEKLKLLVHMDHAVLKAATQFEIDCYQKNVVPFFRTTGSFVDDFSLDGKSYTSVESRSKHYLNHKVPEKTFLGYKGLSYAYSPLSGFLYDGTIGTLGASINPSPSACAYSYFMEFTRDKLFAEGQLPHVPFLSNFFDYTPEKLKSELKGRNMLYAITLPKDKVSVYQKLFHLADCPYYMGVLGCGELFHPRMKGTYQKVRQFKDSEEYTTSLLPGALNPWKDCEKTGILTLRVLINHFKWMSDAEVIAVDGEVRGPQHDELVEKIHKDSLELSRIIRKAVGDKQEKEMVAKLIEVSPKETVFSIY